jgi:hypothetical protein
MFPTRTRVNFDFPQADCHFYAAAALGDFLHLGETVISNCVSHLKAGNCAESQF